MTPQEILDLPLGQNDAKAATIRDYLKALLAELWREEESFSGWQYEIYPALTKAGAVAGTLDSDGYTDDIDKDAADAAIQSAIAALR